MDEASLKYHACHHPVERPLPAAIASVRHDNRAGHEAGRIAGQEQNDRRDFLYASHPVHGGHSEPMPTHDLVLHGFGRERRVDVGGGNGIDPNAAGRPLSGQRLCEVMYACFGGVIKCLLLGLVNDLSRHRSDIDDDASAALQHPPPEGSAAKEHAVQIDPHMVAP